MKTCCVCNKEISSGKIICLECSEKVMEEYQAETFDGLVLKWEELGFNVEIERDVMQLTGEENSITIDLVGLVVWIEEWVSLQVLELINKTLKIARMKNEDDNIQIPVKVQTVYEHDFNSIEPHEFYKKFAEEFVKEVKEQDKQFLEGIQKLYLIVYGVYVPIEVIIEKFNTLLYKEDKDE